MIRNLSSTDQVAKGRKPLLPLPSPPPSAADLELSRLFDLAIVAGLEFDDHCEAFFAAEAKRSPDPKSREASRRILSAEGRQRIRDLSAASSAGVILFR